MSGVRVTLYTRQGCHLCEDAKAAMISSGVDFVLEEIDVDTDPQLFERYTNDVPVIAIGGMDTFFHHVDPREFARVVRRYSAS